MLADMDGRWLDAIADVLAAKAKAMSGDSDDEGSLDWDAMHPDDDDEGG